MDWKSTLVSLAVTALASAGAWALTKLWAFLSARASNEATRGAVQAAQEVVASLVAHAEVTLRPAIIAAAKNAMANGKLSAADGANLKTAVLTTLKVSYPDIIADVEKALGLGSGNAVEIYLSGLIERTLGAQRAAGTLPPPAPMADMVAAKLGQATAALAAKADVPRAPVARP